MSGSILNDTKKMLGIEADYTAFDLDIQIHINSVLSTLTQLGIGPEYGFIVEDASALWSDFVGSDPRMNAVKTYVYLKVRMLFDPPGTSFLINALNDQAQELEWRLSTQRESVSWYPPDATRTPLTDQILDGGHA